MDKSQPLASSKNTNVSENIEIINSKLEDKSQPAATNKDINSKDGPQRSALKNINSKATSLNDKVNTQYQRQFKLIRNSNQHQFRGKEKALIQCPFLQRRGYCLKGPRCDFSHKNISATAREPKLRQNCIERNPMYNIPQPNYNQIPFPFYPNYFPPFQHLMFPPLSRPPPLPYPPPLMSLVTRPPAH